MARHTATTWTKTDPLFDRRQTVEVAEEHYRPWRGWIMSRKPSMVSGWWYDIKRDDSGLVEVIHESHIRKVEA